MKVLDFGLAKASSHESRRPSTETRTLSPAETEPAVLGTAAYMSPEQARGLALDRRTDIWAFGCVLYEMLTGQPAFRASTSSDTIAAVLGGEIDWTRCPADTPAALRRLVARCLERRTKARLRDIADARRTSRVRDDVAAGDSGAHAPRPAAPAGVSRRTVLAGGAALGLVGVGVGARGLTRPAAGVAVLPSPHVPARHDSLGSVRARLPDRPVRSAVGRRRVPCLHRASGESGVGGALAATCLPLAVSTTGEMALALGTHYEAS